MSESQRLKIRGNRVGPEKPDPTPVEIPVGKETPLTLREEMMRFIRMEMSQQASKNDLESFEDFDDFSIDDEEPDLTSPYTVTELRDEEGAYLLDPTENVSEGLSGPQAAESNPETSNSPDESPLSAEGAEPEGRDTPALGG